MKFEMTQSMAVLAIGNELTSGQILNRNAAWLSQKLEDLGIAGAAHLVVPDDRPLILEALRYLSGVAKYVFVTGGLGPTSDDFTREVIAEFLSQPLEFSEAEWKNIQGILNSRQVPVREMQKQQAFFPRGARVLANTVGTAAGFYSHSDRQHFWVLPGPPREIQAIWPEVEKQLLSLVGRKTAIEVWKWQCLGTPESEAAEITEAVLENSGLTIGYRVHQPYCEVKVWNDGSVKAKTLAERLTAELGSRVVARNEEDVVLLLLQELQLLPQTSVVRVVDDLSQGYLQQRLHDGRADRKEIVQRPVIMETHFSLPLGGGSISLPSEQEILFVLRGDIDKTKAKCELYMSSLHQTEGIQFTGGRRADEFLRRWCTEKAILTWRRWLQEYRKKLAAK